MWPTYQQTGSPERSFRCLDDQIFYLIILLECNLSVSWTVSQLRWLNIKMRSWHPPRISWISLEWFQDLAGRQVYGFVRFVLIRGCMNYWWTWGVSSASWQPALIPPSTHGRPEGAKTVSPGATNLNIWRRQIQTLAEQQIQMIIERNQNAQPTLYKRLKPESNKYHNLPWNKSECW